MVEKNTPPDGEMTPKGMAELADQWMRLPWRLVHGEYRPLLGGGLRLIDLLEVNLKQGLARDHVFYIALSTLIFMAWEAGYRASIERIAELRALADVYVSSAEKELGAEEA